MGAELQAKSVRLLVNVPLLYSTGRSLYICHALKMGGTAGQRRAEKMEREAAKAEGAAAAKKKGEEDAYWAAAGEGAKSKAQAKREAADANAEAAAASRAEAKRLAKLEEEEMANVSIDAWWYSLSVVRGVQRGGPTLDA